MKSKRTCSECGSSDIMTTTIASGGGYAPDLLPGAHPWWGGGKLEVYVCGACGHFRYFVPSEALPLVRKSKKFRSV